MAARTHRSVRFDRHREPAQPKVPSGCEHRLLTLQRQVGNRAVANFLGTSTSDDHEREADLAGAQIGHALAELGPERAVTGENLSPGAARVATTHTGVDFSGVQVRKTDMTLGSPTALGSTTGDVVTLRSGHHESRSLLGHELAHVAQQRSGRAAGPQLFDPGPKETLTSPRLADNARIMRAFRRKGAIRRGEVGDAVATIQYVLLDAGLELPASTRKTGEPDGDFGKETKEAAKEFQRRNGLEDDGAVGHDTLLAMDKVPVAKRTVGTPLDPDQATREMSPAEYIKIWERAHGRRMTTEEKRTLSAGCIGITALNLGRSGDPPLDLSFSTFEKALEVKDALTKILEAGPAAAELPDLIQASATLATLKNVLKAFPVDANPEQWQVVIFSKRFWSNQDPDRESRKEADPDAYMADEKTGQVDMAGYDYRARPGFVNFDYGWWDPETDSWWHANHAEPGMKVYQSTLEHYSRPLKDFDRQVFTVALARKLT